MAEPNYYLSLFPQALIASMLDPAAFGTYYAVGNRVHARDEAIFFEVDISGLGDRFDLDRAQARCVPHADGSPKRSVYLSIDEPLATIPIRALGRLHLVTGDGRTLSLEPGETDLPNGEGLYLYQEFCPVTSVVASRLDPAAFCSAITQPNAPLSVRRLVFADLVLGDLASDPRHGRADDLPYQALAHIRDVLEELQNRPEKCSKLVQRRSRGGLPWRLIQNAVYVGDADEFAVYPFPDRATLETRWYDWWRSAQISASS